MRSVVLVVALLIACKSESKPESRPPPSPSPPPADAGPDPRAKPDLAEACAAYAEAWCGAAERCYPDWLVLKHGDRTACHAQELAACRARHEQPGSQVSMSSMEACVKAFATKACPIIKDLPECAPPPGALADGAPCVDDSQCAGRLCDRLERGAGDCKRCTTMPGEGKPCSKSARCLAGLECQDDNTCRRPVHGSTCRTSRECATGLFCRDGACRPELAKGGACRNDDECQLGLACVKRKCARPAQVGEGKPCETALLDFRSLPCAPGLECSRETKTCRRQLAVGDACDGDKRFLCPYWAPCRDGKCAVPDASACKS